MSEQAPAGRRFAASPAAGVLAVALVAAAAIALAACDQLMPARSEGEKLWRQRCSECHATNGSGDTPRYMGNPRADLLDETWEHGGDPGSWEMVTRDGVFGTMPGNPDLNHKQMKALMEHLRQLRQTSSGTRG